MAQKSFKDNTLLLLGFIMIVGIVDKEMIELVW